MTYLLTICRNIDHQTSIGTETRLNDVVADEHFLTNSAKEVTKNFVTFFYKIFCGYKNGIHLLLIYKQDISLQPKKNLKPICQSNSFFTHPWTKNFYAHWK